MGVLILAPSQKKMQFIFRKPILMNILPIDISFAQKMEIQQKRITEPVI